MATWNQIKELQERKAKLITETRSIIEKCEKENRSANDGENTQIAAIDKDIAVLESRLGNLKKLYDLEKATSDQGEERTSADFLRDGDKEVKPEQEKRAFDHYLRTGKLDKSIETRALGVGSLAVGPRGFYSTLVETLKAYAGPIQAGAEVLTTSTGTDLPIMAADDTSNVGQLLGESTEETNMTDATLANVTLKAYKYSSKIMRVSIELIQDNAFDLEAYVARAAGERIGRILNQHMTTGTGSSQPKGVVTASVVGKTAVSTTTFTADELLDFVHSIDPAYRFAPGFRLMMHDTVLAFIRKFKDSQNRYLFEYGTNGQPDKILGAQYVVNNDMASAFTTGQKLVVAGDFSRYKVRYVSGAEVLRLQERYAEFGQVGFIGWLRADANLSDASALKHLKLA